ncbi:DnaJ domain-containing protein [Dechloromonas sp. A34]|uniref:DnaJ domain-containing protein n=1 Tax=Dechloromonas sp. A34 TaxID=447588 RepID=UPI002248D61D|nr:DnaJ domain-containing protein [Dechloromonas sp. A34]
MKNHDHYDTLSIDRCASCAEIKRAYRALAQRFHPDVTEDADGERKFKDVAEAYRALKLPASRVAYDRKINNFCVGDKAAGIADPAGASFFDYGFILWRYWPWFWPVRKGDSNKYTFRR